MFIPRIMVIKMSKSGLFFVTAWENYSSEPEKSSSFLLRNGMVNKLCGYCSWGIEGRNIKKNPATLNHQKNSLYFQRLSSC